MRNKGRFVGLTALRNWREIWRVGLDEKSVERNNPGGFADVVRRTERDYSRKRNVISEVEKFFAELRLARK